MTDVEQFRTFVDRETIEYWQRVLWVAYMLDLSGLSTIYQLQKNLAKPNSFTFSAGNPSTRSNIYKIAEGKHSPKEITFQRAEKLVPNCRYLFHLPMWTLFEREVMQDEINDFLLKSSNFYVQALFDFKSYGHGNISRKKLSHYQRQNIYRHALKDSNIESLNILLLLIAEAELNPGDILYFYEIRNIIVNIMNNLFIVGPLSEFGAFHFVANAIINRFLFPERSQEYDMAYYKRPSSPTIVDFQLWQEDRRDILKYLKSRNFISSNISNKKIIQVFNKYITTDKDTQNQIIKEAKGFFENIKVERSSSKLIQLFCCYSRDIKLHNFCEPRRRRV